MYLIDVRQHQASIKEGMRRDPEQARIEDTVESLPSDLRDPMRVRVGRSGEHPFEISVGLHRAAGGDGTLPCPGDVLAAALIACQELTVRMVAANMGIELDAVRVAVTSRADLRGTLAIDRNVKVGVQQMDVRTHVRVRGGDPERARRLLAAAERYCSVLDTLRHPPEITASFTCEHLGDGTPGAGSSPAP
jgi:uncharacterized OsmC-like protein